jgi:hypothetical protein
MTFAWGLDDYPPNLDETPGLVDPRLQHFMENALNDLSAPPPPPPPPVSLTASSVRLGVARAGRPFSASITVWNNGQPVAGTVSCGARLAGFAIRLLRRSSAANGRATCRWMLPHRARGKTVHGTIGENYDGSRVSRSFSVSVRRA